VNDLYWRAANEVPSAAQNSLGVYRA
jgi:hypothetical protein